MIVLRWYKPRLLSWRNGGHLKGEFYSQGWEYRYRVARIGKTWSLVIDSKVVGVYSSAREAKRIAQEQENQYEQQEQQA